jgi:hypothetical protein
MYSRIDIFLSGKVSAYAKIRHLSWIPNLKSSFERTNDHHLPPSKIQLKRESVKKLLTKLQDAYRLVVDRTFHENITFSIWEEYKNPEEIFKYMLDFLRPEEITLLKELISKMEKYQKQNHLKRLSNTDRRFIKLWKKYESHLFFRSIRLGGFSEQVIKEYAVKNGKTLYVKDQLKTPNKQVTPKESQALKAMAVEAVRQFQEVFVLNVSPQQTQQMSSEENPAEKAKELTIKAGQCLSNYKKGSESNKQLKGALTDVVTYLSVAIEKIESTNAPKEKIESTNEPNRIEWIEAFRCLMANVMALKNHYQTLNLITEKAMVSEHKYQATPHDVVIEV